MNPDTKLTIDQLRAICARHHIPFHSHSRITTGFSHEVHRLNDDLVIKLFNRDNRQRFETERALLGSDRSFRKPEVVASGLKGEVTDRDYILMSFVPGLSLGSHWHLATGEQRERLIKQICRSLKVVNGIDPAAVALQADGSWSDIVVRRGRTMVAGLRVRGIINASTAGKVEQVLERDAGALAGSELMPVYWDVHFDNFIVSPQYELEALIDLENVELTALDYPLFVIRKMMDEPEKFLREEDEKYANKRDYAHLDEWYRRYYPEMFAFDDLEQRVKHYRLLDTLHLLADWSHVRELYTKLDELIAL